MKFQRCTSCGCFYTSNDSMCPNCLKKDEAHKSYLKTFIENNDVPRSVQELSFQSGLSLYDINRYLKEDDFKGLRKNIKMLNEQAQRLDVQLSNTEIAKENNAKEEL